MVQSLQKAFGEKIDFAVIKISGTVGHDKGEILPIAIAEKIMEVERRAARGEKGEVLLRLKAES